MDVPVKISSVASTGRQVHINISAPPHLTPPHDGEAHLWYISGVASTGGQVQMNAISRPHPANPMSKNGISGTALDTASAETTIE